MEAGTEERWRQGQTWPPPTLVDFYLHCKKKKTFIFLLVGAIWCAAVRYVPLERILDVVIVIIYSPV